DVSGIPSLALYIGRGFEEQGPILLVIFGCAGGMRQLIISMRSPSTTVVDRNSGKVVVYTKADKIKSTPNPWKLCTVTQVEEWKSTVRIIHIWASGIAFTTVYSLMPAMFVLQGDKIDPHMDTFKVPTASVFIFDTKTKPIQNLTASKLLKFHPNNSISSNLLIKLLKPLSKGAKDLRFLALEATLTKRGEREVSTENQSIPAIQTPIC
ncbi:hypothetical protein AMTR_s00096p00041850, partial [Amborella trichopoda]